MKSKTCLGSGLIILLAMLSLLGYSDVKLKGGIVGVVVDENNEALPGVNVTLTGEKAFAKSQSKVTNEKGVFRFLDLNPGDYELELKFPQFNVLKIENIRVKIGQETPIRARLSPAKLNEEVVVIAQAPLIDTQSAQVSTTISVDQMDKLPQTRYFLDFTEAVAGVNDRGAYGSAGYRTQYGGYYTGSITNSVTLNGVDVGTLSNGLTWVNPALDTIEEVEVLTVGASAAYGNFTGANINVVTKSGTNRFHGGLSSYYTDSSLYGDNSGGEPQLKIGDIKYQTETVATLGGPIIKEKLFFFLAGGYTGEKRKLYEAPNYATKKQPHYQARLDWRVSKNNSVALMFNSDPLDHDNLGLMTGSGPEIASSRVFRSQSVYGSWTSVIKSDTIFTLKYAGFRGKDKDQPSVLDKPMIWDGVYNRKLQSAGWAMLGDRNRDQVNASLTHYADSLLGASHEIELGFEYENSSSKEHDFAAGNVAISIYPYGNLVDVYATKNYDYNGTAKLRAANGFIQDNVKIGRKLT